MRRSIKPLSAETAVSAQITPAPSYFGSLLCKRRSVRTFSTKEMPQEKLERVLADCAGGVERVPCVTTDGSPFHMLRRTIAQGGGICAVGTSLVLLRRSGSMEPGLYKYCAYSNTIHTLNKTIIEADVARSMWWPSLSKANNAAAILVITADFEPKEYKYGQFGGRLSLIEVGCALQNALLSLCDQGLIGYAHGGVDGELMANMFDLSFPAEAPYVAVIFGVPE